MGLLSLASGKSLWRGYEYYKGNHVYYKSNKSATEIEGKVTGSGQNYTVNIDIEHPRKSKCNCPHANGKRIICKHIVAAYFTVLPDEAEKFYTEAIAYQEEEEKRQEEFPDKVCHYVWHMKKSELQEALLQLLFEGPDWQFDRFVRQKGLEDDW